MKRVIITYIVLGWLLSACENNQSSSPMSQERDYTFEKGQMMDIHTLSEHISRNYYDRLDVLFKSNVLSREDSILIKNVTSAGRDCWLFLDSLKDEISRGRINIFSKDWNNFRNSSDIKDNEKFWLQPLGNSRLSRADQLRQKMTAFSEIIKSSIDSSEKSVYSGFVYFPIVDDSDNVFLNSSVDSSMSDIWQVSRFSGATVHNSLFYLEILKLNIHIQQLSFLESKLLDISHWRKKGH